MSIINSLFDITGEERKKLAVWQKGRPIPGYDAAVWRHDDHGNVICYGNHGDRSSQYGWEMDHHPIAASLGGSDDVTNLRPLQCIANASHGGILGGLLNR